MKKFLSTCSFILSAIVLYSCHSASEPSDSPLIQETFKGFGYGTYVDTTLIYHNVGPTQDSTYFTILRFCEVTYHLNANVDSSITDSISLFFRHDTIHFGSEIGKDSTYEGKPDTVSLYFTVKPDTASDGRVHWSGSGWPTQYKNAEDAKRDNAFYDVTLSYARKVAARLNPDHRVYLDFTNNGPLTFDLHRAYHYGFRDNP